MQKSQKGRLSAASQVQEVTPRKTGRPGGHRFAGQQFGGTGSSMLQDRRTIQKKASSRKSL